ncbi:MAG: histidine kinase dimerization/phosphoacceptor domain-containing protein, partial [Xanthomonadales bacterium]|nr:histidine kinase dimerization/phosphoacceptor domain-containing protein [Xanthomonadales bacterium]
MSSAPAPRLSAGANTVVACLVTLALAVLLLTLRSGPALASFQIRQAQETRCDGSGTREVVLPHFTWGSGCRRLLVHHRLPAGERFGQALLISGVTRDARVWVNGHVLRDFDARPTFDSTSHAILLPIPAEALQSGDNELIFQLRDGGGALDRSYLGHVLVGPVEQLTPVFQWLQTLGGDGAKLTVVVALAILVTVLPMALYRPAETGYRWYALAVLFSLVFLYFLGWPLRPLPTAVGSVLAHVALALALWAMLRLSIVLVHAPTLRPWVDRLSGLAVLLQTLLLFPQRWLANPGDVGYRLLLLLQLVMLAVLWWRRRAQGHALAPWLAGAALLILLVGVADSARIWQNLSGTLAPNLLPWGVLYLLVVLLIGQLANILRALDTAENAKRQLAVALDERTLELQQEFQRRQQAEQAQTLAEERQRIMRDMHDGVGGQLVALIGQVEHGGLQPGHFRQQLRRSLDDLRLMIDSLDDACADLGVALGMLRQRLQASLQELPI